MGKRVHKVYSFVFTETYVHVFTYFFSGWFGWMQFAESFNLKHSIFFLSKGSGEIPVKKFWMTCKDKACEVKHSHRVRAACGFHWCRFLHCHKNLQKVSVLNNSCVIHTFERQRSPNVLHKLLGCLISLSQKSKTAYIMKYCVEMCIFFLLK